MINGVIFQKLQSLDEVLTELRSLGIVRIAELEGDWRTRRAIERDLQVLVEIETVGESLQRSIQRHGVEL
jgi:hypothetical protein